jgi:BirA family biotin operon repressor/biotin-[acetyl-CoA-carboxylase] ligase
MDAHIQSMIRELAAGDVVPASQGLTSSLQALGIGYTEDDGVVSLERPLELLDAHRIEHGLSATTRKTLSKLEILWSVDSTNSWLVTRAHESGFHGSVCLAEQQLAGKGRRGRHWVSPFGKSIYLSVGWRMSTRKIGIGGLSLVVGMLVVSALRDLGIEGVGLKWPNDVLVRGGKLAGILVEVAASRRGEANLVIGVGVNLRLDDRDARQIGQQFATVAEQMSVSRNELVSRLIDYIFIGLAGFQQAGFAPYVGQWAEFDVYEGLDVRINVAGKDIHGVDRGVDDEGNLLLDTADGVQAFNAGEVSLRPAD